MFRLLRWPRSCRLKAEAEAEAEAEGVLFTAASRLEAVVWLEGVAEVPAVPLDVEL